MPNLSNYISVPSLSSYRNLIINGDFSVNEFNIGLPQTTINPILFPQMAGVGPNNFYFTNNWQINMRNATGISVVLDTINDGPSGIDPNLTRCARVTTQTAKATLSSQDRLQIVQYIEGSMMGSLRQNVLERYQFVDYSSNQHVLTRVQNPRLITLDGNPASQTVCWFENGTGGTGPHKINLDHISTAFGTGDFTIESWVYIPAWTGAPQTILATRPNNSQYTDGWAFTIQSSDGRPYLYTNASEVASPAGAGNVTLNNWHHIAVSRRGSRLFIFVDGIERAVNLNFTKNLTRQLLGIGGFPSQNTESFTGYMRGIRITKGVGRYGNANFTPPTAELAVINGNNTLMLVNFNGTNGATTFTDSSPFSHTITNPGATAVTVNTTTKKFGTGSGFFNNLSFLQLTTVPSSPLKSLVNQSAFSMEAWIYMTANPVSSNTVGNVIGHGGTDSANFWSFGPRADRKLVFFYWITTSANQIVSNATLNLNQWYHIAVTKQSDGLIRLFIDGVEDIAAQYVPTQGFNDSYPILIGRMGSGYFTGYIDDVRIVYQETVNRTTNFTPPVSREWPTTVAGDPNYNNVSLLLNMNAALTPQPATLSFWTKSSVPGTYSLRYRYLALENSVPGQYLTTFNISNANTWEYKAITIPPTTLYWGTTAENGGVYVGISLALGPGVTSPTPGWSANTELFGQSQTNFVGTLSSTFHITGVQLEAGNNATQFETLPYQINLNRCKRYFQKPLITGQFSTGRYSVTLPVKMRAIPTVTGTGTIDTNGINKSSVRYTTSFVLSTLDAHL